MFISSFLRVSSRIFVNCFLRLFLYGLIRRLVLVNLTMYCGAKLTPKGKIIKNQSNKIHQLTLRVCCLTAAVFLSQYSLCAGTITPPTHLKALSLLMEGNERFVKGEMQHFSYVTEAKDKLLENQAPFAVIVGCSDSRVPPEVIFDRGLGELFVVRVAGNVLGPIEIDSVEYAVEILKAPLIMVLGHQNCGAIKASLQGNVPEFLDAIYPLIKEAFKNCETTGTNALINAINCNVHQGVATLKKSPIIAPLLDQKKVKVVGAYFNFETGKINLISY